MSGGRPNLGTGTTGPKKPTQSTKTTAPAETEDKSKKDKGTKK